MKIVDKICDTLGWDSVEFKINMFIAFVILLSCFMTYSIWYPYYELHKNVKYLEQQMQKIEQCDQRR